jgi:D-amino-acid oxidase
VGVGTRVLVVGAGVIGLSTAIRLREAGYRADIVADHPPLRTTSAVAAAVWYPYRAYPRKRVDRWALQTLGVLRSLIRDRTTGIHRRRTVVAQWRRKVDPAWRRALTGYRRARPGELPKGYQHGHVMELPVIEMPIYLPWLARRFRALGGTIRRGQLTRLEQAPHPYTAIVNCTGLGARSLVGDPRLHPIRGQVVRLGRCSVERITLVERGPLGLTYIVPRTRDTIVGGTAEVGRWSLIPSAATERAILRRACLIEPRLGQARILERMVGLRPGRNAVRVALGRLADGRPVCHNYGHGGSGVTLSWGCAAEVVNLLGTSMR